MTFVLSEKQEILKAIPSRLPLHSWFGNGTKLGSHSSLTISQLGEPGSSFNLGVSATLADTPG